jgi:hypothetical protein
MHHMLPAHPRADGAAQPCRMIAADAAVDAATPVSLISLPCFLYLLQPAAFYSPVILLFAAVHCKVALRCYIISDE